MAVLLALDACPAPSEWPTLVVNATLSENGNTYKNPSVWMRIPMVASVACGLLSKPHKNNIISYHHHSKHTEMQLSGFHPWKAERSVVPFQGLSGFFENKIYSNKPKVMFIEFKPVANAIPFTPKFKYVAKK